ncbi:MAG: glutamate--tRNA ligase family protein, partial [Pseudomonadota bacterium]
MAGRGPVPTHSPVFRFAPSPNGYLHMGHASSALTCAHLANVYGGRFLLRIEDIDVGRCRPEFVDAIYDDLDWLGLTWEQPVLFQSQRFDAYRAAAESLDRIGLLYPCFASRREVLASAQGRPLQLDPDG